jgi:multisubunit Na+/H+ antiporter MnhG subunit
MGSKLLMTWFSVVSALLVLAGVFFAFFGLGVLRVSKDVLRNLRAQSMAPS